MGTPTLFIVVIALTIALFGAAVLLFRLFLRIPDRRKDESHELDPEQKIVHPFDDEPVH